MHAAVEKEEKHNLNIFQDFCLKHGSSHGLNLALTGLLLPNVLGTD